MKKVILLLIFVLVGLVGLGQTATPGVTVLVHGFDPLGGTKWTGIDTWQAHAIALREYAKTKVPSGNAVVLINDEKLGIWKILEKNKKGYKMREVDINPTTYDGEVIFVYNWGDLSNDNLLPINEGEDAAEAAADNLFSMLINTYELNDLNGNLSTNYLQNKQIHFIAHSRGNVVSLQVFNRFLKYFNNSTTGNITISQWTALDPHPASKMGDVESELGVVTKSLPYIFGRAEGCNNNATLNFKNYGYGYNYGSYAGILGVALVQAIIYVSKIKGVCGSNNNIYLGVPENILKVDNYYRQSDYYEPLTATGNNFSAIGEFSGVSIPNASFNNKLSNSVIHSNADKFGSAHGEVVNWYWGTFDYLLDDTFTNPNEISQITIPKVNMKNPSWYSTNVDTLSNWYNTSGRNYNGFYYSRLGGGYSQLPIVPGVSVDNSDKRQIKVPHNSDFEFNNRAGWKLNGADSTNAVFTSFGSVKLSKKNSKLEHSYFYFPPTANKLKIKIKRNGPQTCEPENSNICKGIINYDFKDSKNDRIKSDGNIGIDITSAADVFKEIVIPNKLKGRVGKFILRSIGNLPVEIDEVKIINSSSSNLRQSASMAVVLDLNAKTYYDFPIAYNVNPNPLIKGERPTSFKATITNTMPQFWSGTLKMYWRKISDDGKGQPLKEQAVNLAPGASVTLDRGTDFIISEPDDYILGIYANNDDVPIDEYFFYVEDQDSEEVLTPTISVSPGGSTHTFGSVVVGSTDGQTFTIRNTSNTAVNITGVSITGTGFSAGTSTCCGTLAPNQSYDVKVNTSPTDATVYTGQMQISGNFTGSPITVALSTQGVYNTPPVTGCLSASVSTVNIQSGNTDALKQQYFGLTNNSLTGSVNITGVSFTGADASYFAYDGNLFSVPSALAPATTTGFLVKFINPQSINRTYNASLVFTTDNPSCASFTIPVSASHIPSQLSWLLPEIEYTIETLGGGVPNSIKLQWQGYISASNGNVPPVDIQYTVDGGTTWTSRNNTPANYCTTGHNNLDSSQNIIYFPIDQFGGKDIQFRIKPCYDNTSPWQYSAISHVTAPGQQTLQVLYPNGYEIFNSGQNIKIKWANYIGYKSVNITLTVPDANGNPVTTIIANNVSGQATEYNWIVPNGIYSEYAKIMVSAANVSDASDYSFFIQPTVTQLPVVSDIRIRPEGCKTTPEGNLNLTITGVPTPHYVEIRKLSNIDNVVANETLTSGEYLCIVNTNANRRVSFNFTVPKNTAFTHSIIAINDTCSGSKGSISVRLGNTFQYLVGNSSYNATFSRNGVQVYSGTNTSISNQSAGYFEVSVKDGQQCGFTENLYLDSSTGTYFNLTPTITNTSCSGNIGAISLNIGAAQSPTYLWSNSATTQNISNLASGQYSVIVTDGTGCVQSKSVEIITQGSWNEQSISRKSFRDMLIDGNKLYYDDFYSSSPINQVGILDINTNVFDNIRISSFYQTTNNIEPYKFDVNNGFLYIVYQEYKPNVGNEIHFLKVNISTKSVVSRVIISNLNSNYTKTQFINGKLYCLRQNNSNGNFLDIINFSTSTYSSIPISITPMNFTYSPSLSKLFFVGTDAGNTLGKVAEFDITTAVFNRTANVSVFGNQVEALGNNIYFAGGISGQTSLFLQKFDVANFLTTSYIVIGNNSSSYNGRTVIKDSQYLYIHQASSGEIQVVDLSTFSKVDKIITSSPVMNLVYSQSNDKLYASEFGNIGIVKLTSNKFDFTSAKTDATCGQNNGSITLTMPNDGKTYTYLWSNGATTKDISSLSAGDYLVTVTQTGGCAVKKTIQILQNSTAVNAPTGIPNGRCGAGSVTLGASGCNGTYTWYNGQNKQFMLGTGSSFAYNYTVSSYAWVTCSVGSCESVPTGVVATINTTPVAPTVPSVTINNGHTAILTASNCNGTINWFTQSTGGSSVFTGNPFTTPVLTTTTTFYAECTFNTCTSTTRGSGNVTINSITTCQIPQITTPTGTNLTATTANIQWNSTPININLRYRVLGATMWNTANNLTSTQTWLTGLLPNTNYEAQVQTICSGGILSAFTTSINFTTLNCSNMYSLKTGIWNDISVWSCGRLPNSSDIVTISIGNVVTIPSGQTGFLHNLIQKGILVNNGLLKFRN